MDDAEEGIEYGASGGVEPGRPLVCEACGRGPARAIAARRQVGLLLLRRSYEARVVACRSCGRGLVERYTARTLWQGWWGIISFFANWFVLLRNAATWVRIGRLAPPTLSGELPEAAPGRFPGVDDPAARPGGRPRAELALAGGGVIAVVAAAIVFWDGSFLHEHEGEHGVPLTAPEMEAAIADGAPFVDEEGRESVVRSASCSGDGEAAVRYTHFDCRLVYGDGESEEVLVHLLEGDEIFFTSFHR